MTDQYCVLDSENIIINIIVTDENSQDIIDSLGAKPFYEGAVIGAVYDPPVEETEPTLEEKVETLENENTLLKAQIQAESDREDFIEDCIAEMATVVYS